MHDNVAFLEDWDFPLAGLRPAGSPSPTQALGSRQPLRLSHQPVDPGSWVVGRGPRALIEQVTSQTATQADFHTSSRLLRATEYSYDT